jgi:hypothetical protein
MMRSYIRRHVSMLRFLAQIATLLRPARWSERALGYCYYDDGKPEEFQR